MTETDINNIYPRATTAHVLVTETDDRDGLTAAIVLPPWSRTFPLAFHSWNTSAADLAGFVQDVQAKARQEALPALLEEDLLEDLAGFLIREMCEPTLVIRRGANRAPEAALQVCAQDGAELFDLVCARIESQAREGFEPAVRDLAGRTYHTAIRTGIDCSVDFDLLMYMPARHDLARPGKQAGA